MKTLFITITNNISYDQRMHKIASHLAITYNVTIIGSSTRKPPPLDEQVYKQKRLKTIFQKGILFYAEFNLRLFFFLLFKKIDLLYSVDLDTLLTSYALNLINNQKYVYDSHEYFTELPELQGRTFVQKVWQWIENMGVPKALACITVNDELAAIFSKKHRKEFNVVRNTPVYFDNQVITKENIFIYQGALNKGRGLEQLIEVMKFFPQYTLEIAGGGPMLEKLKNMVKEFQLENVVFHGMLQPSELKAISSKAKIGFNLLLGESLNYYYSLANKFFDYVMMEIPVITMKFPVYKRLVEKHRVGELIDNLELKDLKQAITKLLDDKYYNELCINCKEAKKEWNWGVDVQVLDEVFKF